MDIQQWLAATTDRAPPQPSDDHHIPDAFRAHPHPHSPDRQLPRGRSYRRKKRTGASSDSSLIPPRRADRGVGQPAACSLPSERGRPVRSSGRGSDRSRSVSTSAFASLSPEPAPEKTYERRPRHKTRPDRYEPRSKKQKGHHDVRKEKKSGKKRRKSHRGGDGGRTAGLVQSFQLRNGPKNSRLTMKPITTVGLFKHGRASVQVSGRGGGLPDLVFNEMKFLRRPTEHEDAAPGLANEQHRSKKDRKRPDEGDISAYFAAREPRRGRCEGRRDAADRLQPVGDDENQAQAARRPHHSTPPVELPSRPFLGLGSKGVHPEGKESHSGRTTYFTWSQSPYRQPPHKRKRHSTAPIVDTGPFSMANPTATPRHAGRTYRLDSGSVHDTRQRDTPSRRASRGGPWRPNTREEGSALVELYQPPVRRSGRDGETKRSTTKTPSQSLPRNSPKRPIEGDADQDRHEDLAHHEYHTSDILRIDEDDGQGARQSACGYVPSAQLQPEKENQNPMSALSIDRLLNDARQLTTTATIEDRVATDDGVHAPESQAAEETDAPSVAVQIPPVHGEAVRTFAQNPRLLLPASGRASGIHGSRHEQTAPQRRRVLYDAPPARQAHVLETVARPFDLHSHHLHAAEDEEMLDYGPDSSLATTPQEPVYASLQQAEALAFAPGSSTLDRDSWAAPSPQVDLGAGSYREPLELTPNNTLLSRSVSVGRTRQGDHPAAPASGDGLHGLSGFWRPNMLY